VNPTTRVRNQRSNEGKARSTIDQPGRGALENGMRYKYRRCDWGTTHDRERDRERA
jgi:hypothetical protein